jgi:hypothetical protein
MLRSYCCVAVLLTSALTFAQPAPTTQGTTPQDSRAIGEVFASDASVHGSVILTGGGTRLLSGSTVTAGAQTASVRLVRGGELRVCPDTGITVSANPGRDLMLGLSSGALEAHYSLSASADTIVTPDFRLLLMGPGEFHVAIATDFKGNACVKSLPGNTASVFVWELMGSGSYQIKAGQQVYFRNGSVADAGTEPLLQCGCPGEGSQRNVQRAVAEPPSVPLPNATPPSIPAAEPTQPPPVEQVSAESLPVSMPGDVHVQVEVPFVFSASEPEPAPEPSSIAGLKPLETSSIFDGVLAAHPEPPPTPTVKKRRGFFGRVGGFFYAMFGGK